MKTRIAIIGYGNIGKAVEQAVQAADDMQLVGVYHHNDNLDTIEADVAALCTPTREVPAFAEKLLRRGISTVDSFDIHGQIYDLRKQLTPMAQANKAVSIIAAGWDPGSDSMVRALLTAIAPKGITYTNFGPGRSMGHTVAAKAIPGVKNALSMTIPLGTGIHRRMVYIELEEGADFATVEKLLLQDDYFAHDETCDSRSLGGCTQQRGSRRAFGARWCERRDPQPAIRVQHGDQQPRTHWSGIGGRSPCGNAYEGGTAFRRFHDDRTPADLYAPWR